jgi:hypothetical protein
MTEDEKQNTEVSEFSKVRNSQSPSDFVVVKMVPNYKVTHACADSYEKTRVFSTLEEALALSSRCIYREAVAKNKESRAHAALGIKKLPFTITTSFVSLREPVSGYIYISTALQAQYPAGSTHSQSIKFTLFSCKTTEQVRVLKDKFHKCSPIGPSNYKAKTIFLGLLFEDNDEIFDRYYSYRARGNKTAMLLWYPVNHDVPLDLDKDEFVSSCLNNIVKVTTSGYLDDSISSLLPLKFPKRHRKNETFTMDPGVSKFISLYLGKTYEDFKAKTPRKSRKSS